jgi:hypothetical protein
MPASAQRSPETIAAYERETGRLVAQCQCENPSDGPQAPLVQTVHWFLNGHARGLATPSGSMPTRSSRRWDRCWSMTASIPTARKRCSSDG